MQQRMLRLTLAVLFALAAAAPVVHAEPNDREALAGVATGKALFDVNISDDEPEKLALYLRVIGETHAGLLSQNVSPDIIIAFRGRSVRLVSRDSGAGNAIEREAKDKIASLISDLQKKGVRFEACSIATRLFKIDNNSLLPGIRPVGNTFISLTGYQAKGYALIPLM